jgi:hypothetical protein
MGIGGNDGMTDSRNDWEIIIPLETQILSRRKGQLMLSTIGVSWFRSLG